MINMRISERGIVEMVGHEGVSLTKYNDRVGKGWSKSPTGKRVRGVLTVGSGLTKTEIPDLASWSWSKKITMEQVFILKRKAIKRYERAINKKLKREVPQHVFDALVSWSYNVGIGWVKVATVMRRINKGESLKRVAQALLFFKKPRDIIGRRKKEAKLILTGEYSNNGNALLFTVSKRGYALYKGAKTINVWEYMDASNPVQPSPVEYSELEVMEMEKEIDESTKRERTFLTRLFNFWT